MLMATLDIEQWVYSVKILYFAYDLVKYSNNVNPRNTIPLFSISANTYKLFIHFSGNKFEEAFSL